MRLRTQEMNEKKLIDDILENFDFEKCQQTMNMLNWTWHDNRFVTVDMLKNMASRLLRDAIDSVKEYKTSKTSTVSSGGLSATVIKNRYNHILSCHLDFILTTWDADNYGEFDNLKE